MARAAVRPGPTYDELGGPVAGGGGGKDPSKAAKRRRRTNILTAASAVLVILLGAGVVAGTWFFDSVQLTEPKAEDQVSQLFAADGKTQLATLGDTNRSLVPYQGINPDIKNAVMAAEDKDFLNHHGIDMKGILRAAWNNFTDGDTQGASTITQQYARHAADLKEISYNRKLREAVIARRIEDKYDKNWILGAYLNSVYFGRGAYGIEAAVKAYFGNSRSSLIPPGKPGAITPAEAAVIASVIKQPEPDTITGHKGYDPQNNPADAKLRWDYTINNMLEKGWLKPEDKPAKYPAVKSFNQNACRTDCGGDKATGKIVKYIKQELRAMGINDEAQSKGGLRITTTINAKVQAAAVTAANRTSDESPMNALGSDYKDALVSVDPETGRVLAYYGGPEGTGWDYAGPNFNETGDFVGGGRPMGSSFKIYTLLAGLSDNYGFDTEWDSEAKKVGGDAINNADRDDLECDKRACPLDIATVQSYNFPFYWLTDKLGSKKVLEAARAAGVQYIGSPTKIGERIDLTKLTDAQAKQFGNELGYGQYSITPLDHANGTATLANDGKYNKAHFIRTVQRRDEETGKFKVVHEEQLRTKQVFQPGVVADLDNVLAKIVPKDGGLKDGRAFIGKSGTWEFRDGKSNDNGDASWVGATRHLATSVWVGREKANKKTKQNDLEPIFESDGGDMFGGGTPGAIWKKFTDLATEAMNFPNDPFPQDVNIGDPNKKGNGVEKKAPTLPNPGLCLIPALCQNGGRDGQPGGTPTKPGDNNGPGNQQNNQNQQNQDNTGIPNFGGTPPNTGASTDQGGEEDDDGN